MHRFQSAAAAVLLACVLQAQASITLIEDPKGLVAVPVFPATVGYSFVTGGNAGGYRIDALGIFDLCDNGLVSTHAVGIWDANKTLIASVTIPNRTAADLESGFRWESVTTGVQLAPDTAYVLGAFYGFLSLDPVVVWTQLPGLPNVEVAEGFKLIGGRLTYARDLTYPEWSCLGAIGPNIQLTAVPEPATLFAGALLLLPFGAALIRRQR